MLTVIAPRAARGLRLHKSHVHGLTKRNPGGTSSKKIFFIPKRGGGVTMRGHFCDQKTAKNMTSRLCVGVGNLALGKQ